MSSGSGRSDPLSEFILGRPMADGPGARFLYGGASHLLSVILAHATGMSTREFVNADYSNHSESRPENGPRTRRDTRTVPTASTSPPTIWPIGYLYLQNGVWDHRQIVPAAWVRESTASQNAGGLIPDLDMVVAMTGNSNLPPTQLSDHRHVIRQFLVPAVRDDNRR